MFDMDRLELLRLDRKTFGAIPFGKWEDYTSLFIGSKKDSNFIKFCYGEGTRV